jgi:universal stress protein E
MGRSILVIADEHDHDKLSLEKAHAIASPLSAKLEVVRFLSQLESPDHQVRKQTLDKAKKQLEDDILAIFDDGDVVAYDVISTDKIADWVVNTCTQKHFDLVVKTGHRTETLFHTPTDWKLMRQLSCPILIANNHKWKSKEVVMAAVDLSTQEGQHKALNEAVLHWTSVLADAFNFSAHIVYSIPIAKPLLALNIVEQSDYQQKKLPQAKIQLSKLLDKCAFNNANTHVTAGPPEKTIPHVANELKADLVIMGCIGRKGLKGFLVGNTAEKVLHHLRTDTLIVETSGLKKEHSITQ